MRGRVTLALCAAVIAPLTPAAAQWAPGSELIGQSAQVSTNGIVDTVYFDQGGAARIVSGSGTTVPATWTAAAGSLCLNTPTAQECWPYAAPFQAGQPMTLTSSCGSTDIWTAAAVNMPAPPPPPPPMPSKAGERG